MNKRYHLVFAIVLLSLFPLPAKNTFTAILQNELMRNYNVLKNKDIPACYIGLRVEETTSHTLYSSFGALNTNEFNKGRRMYITMRVGDRNLDNLHFSGNLQNQTSIAIPDENIEEAIKLALWRGIQNAYSKALDDLKTTKTKMTTRPVEQDKSPDFSIEKASMYYEKPTKFNELGLVEKEMTLRIDSLSGILSNNRDIFTNSISCQAVMTRKFFVDTEGADIVQNNGYIRMYMGAAVMAEDGMVLPVYKSYFGRNAKDLPTFQQMKEDVLEMSQTLSALKISPTIDSYTGPVMLSGEVSGVFFHEFLGHRIEGARMKSGYDSQTLKKKIGEEILPKGISVIYDPTLPKYRNVILSGNYKFDDEGIPGQRVEVIKDGMLKNFLMSRIPIEGFPKSNGHGRGNLTIGTETRQSNMIVESSNLVSLEELKILFINELKSRGLKFGYRIEKVSGGLTITSAASANAFYLNPLVVLRVYTDGRPDELVRGINIVGTPLVAFSQIIAVSNDQKVFNGICGALSGSVSVSTVAPSLLIKELEFQKTGDTQKMEPFILERPY